ncbi:hypothetical protein QJS10_CPA06g00703 [Acorus calamus]|uniref:Uncharacterized protein n=1 Tax=Acorus calamus TaxID=4465 RepID=A0AAV9EKB1_ACOCL|nr:hypothetical protein QJS10_CPA06g00703 [Acorus calamus]
MDLNEVPQDEAASSVCAGPEQLVSVQGNPRMQSYSNSFENFHTENKNMANSRCINSIQSESCQGNRNSTGQSSSKQAHCLESSINRRASQSGTLSFLDKGKKHHSEVGPLDAYTSDAISAMNLLRLMDPMSSTAPSSAPHVKKKNYNHKELPAYKDKGETNKVSPNAARFDSGGPSQPVRNSLKRLLPRPMIRPSNIAQRGRVEHSEMPHIANNSHSREFLGLESSGETSMVSPHPSAFRQFSRVSLMGNSFSGYYPIPGQKIGMLGSPLHDISGHPNNFRGFIGRNNVYYGGINFTSQFTNVGGREKYFPMVDNSGFFNINAHAQPVRFHHHPEGSLSALNNGSSSNHSETNTDRRDGTIQPTESSGETETCHLNQNPAEFSLPVMSNAYTIGFNDLDPRKGRGIHYPYMHMNNIK